MKMMIRPALTLLSILLLTSGCGRDQTQTSQRDANPESAKIRQNAKVYSDAFNRKDAKTLAKLWADDATLIHPDTGVTLQGTDAIEEYFREFLGQLGDAKIDLQIKSIIFPRENVAVEEGTSTLTRKGSTPEVSSYRAYYEKQKGDWRLVEVEEPLRDEGVDAAAEHLKDLEWLIGNWVDNDKDYEISTSSRWDDHKKFIVQKFSVAKDNVPTMEGNQIIAWDPARETIRSWVFDSAGGFGEGRWTKKGNTWVVETAFTLANGDRASSVNIYSKIGPDTYTWQSTGREVAGEFHPDISPLTVTRKKY
jgi:uncharacterized protein (TIGR02246 family)